MTMRSTARSPTARPRGRRAAALRALAAGLAGLCAALIVSCGSSGQGLIPAAAAGPLKRDFEAVQQSAEAANGDCTTTEAALLKTAEDFNALPSSVDAGLRSNLRQGIANLRKRAQEMCREPSAQTTTTAPTTTTATTPTTTPTITTPTTPTPPATTTPTTPSPGGGTAAPGEEEEAEGAGKGKDKGNGNGHGGTGAGEGGAGGVGAGELEGGK
jgi:hypothetical protein